MYTPPTDGFVDKIIDFGFATAAQPCQDVLGTAAYVAPEVISDLTYDGWAVDMYTCGVMLYVMLCGAYPFPSRGIKGVGADMSESSKEAIRHSAVSLEGKGLSVNAKKLIRSLMHNEPTTRPTAVQALDDSTFLRRRVEVTPSCRCQTTACAADAAAAGAGAQVAAPNVEKDSWEESGLRGLR